MALKCDRGSRSCRWDRCDRSLAACGKVGFSVAAYGGCGVGSTESSAARRFEQVVPAESTAAA
jgi:hypothetical protein